MTKSEYKTFGYYFLNKRLHPPFPSGYRVSIVLLIINKNKSENRDKFLIVQQTNNIWGLPKEGVKSKITIEDLYTTISRNLEQELGFRGIKVVETKPAFKQVGLLFDFDRQEYDTTRSKQEGEKGRPTKGKIYLLSIMEYRGPDKIPLIPNNEVIDYRWIDESGWRPYDKANAKEVKTKKLSPKTSVFTHYLVNKSIKVFRTIEKVIQWKFEKGQILF